MRNQNSLIDCFNQFFKVDKLEGNNKYKCSKCNKLVNAQKRFWF